MMKRCSFCKIDKDKKEFHKHSSRKDGLQTACIQCQYLYKKQWAEHNPDKAKASSQKWVDANHDKRLITYKKYRNNNHEERRVRTNSRYKNTSINATYLIPKYKDIPCMDCKGVFPFVAMDFDHRLKETKCFSISKYRVYKATPENITKVALEIDKCDLVCSNCHRIRTWGSQNDDRI